MFSFEQGNLNNEIAEEIRHDYQSQECSGFTVEEIVNTFFLKMFVTSQGVPMQGFSFIKLTSKSAWTKVSRYLTFLLLVLDSSIKYMKQDQNFQTRKTKSQIIGNFIIGLNTKHTFLARIIRVLWEKFHALKRSSASQI